MLSFLRMPQYALIKQGSQHMINNFGIKCRIINQFESIIYHVDIILFLQGHMDKSNNLDKSLSTVPQKKKRYKQKQSKGPEVPSNATGINQSSFQLTKTQINPLSKVDMSSIHEHNVSVLTEKSNVGMQSNFLSSQLGIKTFLIHQPQPQQQETYTNCKESIDDKDLLKVLKKYTKKIFDKAKNIQIFYTSTKPSLVFHFNLQNENQTKKMSLKDIIKANKQIGKNQSKNIQDIFDKLYDRIGEEFCKILQVVKGLAEQKRIQLNLPSLKKIAKPLLYYSINKKSINFVLFDNNMRIFQFNNTMIKKLKMEQKHEKIWTKFENMIQNRRKQGEQRIIEQYGQYEASSDEESKRTVVYQQRVDVQGIKRKLKEITTMPLNQYEDQIQEKEQLFNQMQKKADHKTKAELQKLADDLGELQSHLDNFKQAVESVEKQQSSLRPVDGQRYKNLLKKMILAKKQLENKLPITAKKRQIFNALDKNNLIILQGETGSGKSTQLPQMMCEYFNMFDEKGKSTLPILITQPRKLATRTVAQRVASQMHEKIGGFVDYATSAHKPVSKTAKIIFKMDSLVLDQITTDRLLNKYSCLIIDQAHERTISIDVILGLIKQLLTKRDKFKVIVTSASLDAKLFSDYFKTKVMKVSGRLYPVEVIYRNFHHESDTVKKIENVIKNDILINSSQIRKEYKGDILVFCSGVEQINILCNIFHKYVNPRVFQVYPLHGRIAPEEQKLIFLQTKQHKIIFASRIAQTSITINGVKVVVDPGYDRQEVYDQKNRVSSRKLLHISQSSAKQRAGRAGRTSKGFCFRLYSEAQMHSFRRNKTPEIENMALDTLVLRLKMLNVQEIFKFAYINKPDDKALQKSVQTLQMIGAITFQGEITTIGKLLLQLRIEPFLGRAIVQAIICQQIVQKTQFTDKYLRRGRDVWKQAEIKRLKFVKQSIIQILSMVINSSNIFTFLTQFDKNRDNLDSIKFRKFSDQRGDFFYLLNIYDQFIYNFNSPNRYELSEWLRSRFLNRKTLMQAKQLVEEISQTVKNFHIDLKDPSYRKLITTIQARIMQCKTADDVILACMMTSFCVNLCLYSNNPNIGYTLILQKKPITIYGTSTLALLSRYPKWIICYDLKTNDRGITYCQIAHEIDYNFMKRTVDDQVFDRLNLKQAEKMNPFYQTIQRQLPTLILQEINNDYINRQNLTNPVFKYLSIIINEETNTISISWAKQLKMSDIQGNVGTLIKCTINEFIESYIYEKMADRKLGNLNFHLMSNVYLEMKDGFMIKKLHFTSMEIEFLVQGEKYELYDAKNLLQGYNINCKRITQRKLKIFTILQSQKVFVKSCLQKYGLIYQQFIIQRKQSSLNAKIYMKFYTGKPKSDQQIFMYYGKDSKVFQMCDILEASKKYERLNKKQERYNKYLNILLTSIFKPSKNETGIRCRTKADAFQLKQALQYLAIYGVLPFTFQFPSNYRQFRQVDHTLAMKNEKEWQTQIQKVFTKEGFQDIAIKVKGDDIIKKQQRQNLKNMESMMRFELSAQITGESIQKLDELVKKLDGKQKLIGAGKIHFRYNFKQFIIKVNIRAFNALKDLYSYIKDKYELQSAQLRIETYQRTFGRVTHIFINCRSPIRQKLLEPSEKIRQLFTPFILRLESSQFNFLLNSQQGEDFLRKIEEDYSDHIYISFERKKNHIKIYCQQQDFNSISQRIQKIFEKYTFCVDKVSYKGKGLNRVTALLEKQAKRLYQLGKSTKSNRFLQYNIIFKTRQIQLEGDDVSINNIKGQISNLVNEEPGSCHICLKNVQKPYRLFNCDHSFCWKCLGDYIQQQRKEENNGTQLLCPEDNCYKAINSYDMKSILSTEQFQSYSMKRVRQYVSKEKFYFFCPTTSCDQLFQEASIAKSSSFQCYMCGKWYCSKCKQPHQHFTCEQWASKLAKGQLSKFGFKKCICGAVLHKEVRQKLIQCKQCKEYLCWTCLKRWKSERSCQDHIRACKL